MDQYLVLTSGGQSLVLTVPGLDVIAAPSGLTATAVSSGRTDLTWVDNSANETGFILERSLDGSTGWTPVATPPANVTGTSDTGLSPSTTYFYRIKATNGVVDSPYSNVVSVTTPASSAATLLTTVTLTNTSSSPTDSRTLLRLGSPTKQGDLPTGSRVKLTWTPSGGTESGDLPVQQDFVVSHPDDSVRFCGLAFELPQVAGSGSGVLSIYSEAGSPNTTLPGGRTPAEVVADLASGNFPGSNGGCFGVSVLKLTKGREKIAVSPGGTAYSSSDTLAFSGGVGGTPPASNLTAVSVDSGGTISAARFQAPIPRYDPTQPVPAVSVVTSTGSGAVLTYSHPALDGSSPWSWSASTQLGMLGGTDSRGRTRCEVISSGPLCVTLWCWGPLTDGINDHPHLSVRGYYHCWLASDGSIDRVEYFHTIGQGWIEDLNGGTVKADIQIGDVSVSCGGVPLEGQSWTSLRMPPFAETSLTTVDSSNYHTGGSRWTSGYPTLHATFDAYYWRSTGVVPPYDLDYHIAKPVIPWDLETTVTTYAPGFRPTDTANGKFFGQCPAAINGVGAGPHLGVLPRWAAKAFLTQSADFVRMDLAMAHVGQLMPNRWRNPKTGRIAHCSAGYDGGTDARMGAARSSSFFINPTKGGATSADFVIATEDKGLGNGDVTNSFGGWIPDSGYTTDHFPSFAYHAYLRTAQPWFLETVKLHGTNPVVGTAAPGFAPGQTATNQVGGNRDCILPDGTTLNGRFTSLRDHANVRAEAWAWKLLYQCLAVLPDDAIERPYFESIYDGNSHGALVFLQSEGQRFHDQGAWAWPQPTFTKDPAYPAYIDFPFMQHYLYLVRCCKYLALGRPADTRTFLDHHVKQHRGYLGGYPGNPCSFGACGFQVTVGDPAVGPYGWDEVNHSGWTTGGGLDLDAATGRVSGAVANIVQTPFTQTDLEPGDWLLFIPTIYTAAGNVPPASGTSGGASVPIRFYTRYYIAEVNAASNWLTISPNADLSNPFTAFSSSVTNVGGTFAKRASCPVPSSTPGSVFARKTAEAGAGGDTATLGGCARIAVACGLIDTSDAFYQNAVGPSGRVKYLEDNRWTLPGNNYQGDPTWHMGVEV